MGIHAPKPSLIFIGSRKKTLMKELEVNERTISCQGDLSHYITKFYTNLYASEVHASGTLEAQRRC
jgi:ABC-type enterochelin transport system substrate-binding protein